MFTLNLVTPEKRVVTDVEIDEVIVPGERGQLDILPGHAPLVTTLQTGIMKYRLRGESELHTAVVSWGYCEIHPLGVTVLADLAESVEEIDRAQATAHLETVQQTLLDPLLEADQIEVWQRKLEHARARIDALQ